VKRLRALADKRQKEAAREGRLVAQGLLGAADGYRALADALERQPSLSWLQPKPQNTGHKDASARWDKGPRDAGRSGDPSGTPESISDGDR
jgi:hypothetical protein